MNMGMPMMNMNYPMSIPQQLPEISTKQKPQLLEGHNNVVRSISIHPTKPLFCSGSSDRKIRLWEFNKSVDESRIFIGPNSSITDVNFIGEHICIAYKCGTIKYIHPDDPTKSFIFDTIFGKIEGFYPLGFTYYVVWNENVGIMTYENVRQKNIFTYNEHQRKITIVRPLDEHRYLSGSSDRTVHIWDTRIKTPTIHRFKPHKSGVIQMETINENQFCTVGNEKIVCEWDERMLKSPVLSIENKTEILKIKENKIFCGLENRNVGIYDLHGKELRMLENDYDSSSLSAMDVHNGTVVCGMKNGSIFVYSDVY